MTKKKRKASLGVVPAPSHTVLLHFDLSDPQTLILKKSLFDPLCTNFHVSITRSVRLDEVDLGMMCNALQLAAAGCHPFVIVPTMHPFIGTSNHVGVPMECENTAALSSVVAAIASNYPEVQSSSPVHATLQKSIFCETYLEKYRALHKKYSTTWSRENLEDPLRMRVVGLRLVQTCGTYFVNRDIFLFPNPTPPSTRKSTVTTQQLHKKIKRTAHAFN